MQFIGRGRLMNRNAWFNDPENTKNGRKNSSVNFEDIPLNTFASPYEDIEVPFDIPFNFNHKRHTYENVKPLSLGSELRNAELKSCKFNPLKKNCRNCKSEANICSRGSYESQKVYQSFDFGLDATDMAENDYESPNNSCSINVEAEVYDKK